MVFKKAEIFTGIEKRRFSRIRDNSEFLLYSPEGPNRACSLEDISGGGLCFESNGGGVIDTPHLKCEIKIPSPSSGSLQTIPARIKPIWSVKIGERYRIGAEFSEISDTDRAIIFKRIAQLVKAKRLRLVRKEFIARVLLIIAILAGVAVFIFQYRTFSSIRNSLETALSYSEKERVRLKTAFEGVRKEKEVLEGDLANAKTLLVQAEGILKSERIKFNTEIEILKKDIQRLENEVAGLTDTNMALENRLHNLKELRLAIRTVKKEAYLKKVETQIKIDRIKLLNGNRGYLVKNRKSTLGMRGVIIRVLPAERDGVL